MGEYDYKLKRYNELGEQIAALQNEHDKHNPEMMALLHKQMKSARSRVISIDDYFSTQDQARFDELVRVTSTLLFRIAPLRMEHGDLGNWLYVNQPKDQEA